MDKITAIKQKMWENDHFSQWLGVDNDSQNDSQEADYNLLEYFPESPVILYCQNPLMESS